MSQWWVPASSAAASPPRWTSLGSGRPRRIVVSNRNADRSRSLAESASDAVSWADFDALDAVIAQSDVLFCALDVNAPQLGAARIAPSGSRSGRPLVVVDLGVPRNVDPAAAELPGVTLLGMDELRGAVSRATDERQAEVDAVLAIVAEELDRYRARCEVAAPPRSSPRCAIAWSRFGRPSSIASAPSCRG